MNLLLPEQIAVFLGLGFNLVAAVRTVALDTVRMNWEKLIVRPPPCGPNNVVRVAARAQKRTFAWNIAQ